MTGRRLIRLNEVIEQQPSFLWPGRIVLGGLTAVDGDPGNGKSALTYDFAARVTTGRSMPFCESRTTPSGVALLQAEDSLGCDVLPNLRAAGANTDRIFVYDMVADHPRLPTLHTFQNNMGYVVSHDVRQQLENSLLTFVICGVNA